MEEDLTPEDDGKEYEEFDIDSDNPLFVFCFMFMEYIKEINPELYAKAHKYAQDHTDLDIADFEIVMEDEDEDESEDEEDEDIDYDYDDDTED
jgi:hypothetical protein